MGKTIVVALGGNAIKSAGQKGTYEEQFENVEKTTKFLAQLIVEGYNVVISHGNGPQIGDILIQNDRAKSQVPPMPMFVCVAQTQGSIGLLIQQTLQNHLRKLKKKTSVSTVVTQILISPNDPAFKNPSKPIGPFYKEKSEFAEEEKKGYVFIEDAGRGYRRVVPSPRPLGIIEISVIKEMINKGVAVIAGGGGGVPVYEKNGKLIGIDAIIDKDSATRLLANDIGANIFIILTDVEKVAINFNTPQQKDISKMTIIECKKYIQEGHFAKGSMLPKIEAAIDFLEDGGEKAIITHPFKVMDAIAGKTGTTITK